MSKIIRLEQHVADLIAAGEVVSRPASVVKELLENSIDAGAGIITAEISAGGMTSIRVTDNGCGIEKEDVKTAFLRHATSKLKSAKDLEAIETLGFRGEALAAIAAVSKIEMLTKTAGADTGVRLLLDAGVVRDLAPAGAPAGTTIIVRDLFYNTPARLKFLKTDRAEGSAVSSVAVQVALSRPDISFRYIKDGKTEFHTPGDSRALSCIYSVLGREVEAGFLPVSAEDSFVSVTGFASLPSAARGNRSYQYFFINGRVVRSVLLQSALEQAYRNTLMSGRFPSCVLYITTSANTVDVNVHPAKTDVRFISDKQVFDGVYYAVLGALEKLGAVNDTPKIPPLNEYPSSPAAGPLDSYRTPSVSSGYSAMTVGERKYAYSGGIPDVPAPPAAPAAPSGSAASSPYRVIGEALSSYIVVELEDALCFIDKHAAHERIHYNALCDIHYEPMSQALMLPVICRVGHREASLLLENEALLDSLGFAVESFAEDAVAVRYIPADIRECDVEPVLAEICKYFEHGNSPGSAVVDKIYKTLACKAAIKSGSVSDFLELDALAARVMSGEISHCPHGRPTTFRISKETLDKGFGRI